MFKTNTARYIDIFSEIADELMPIRLKQVDPDEVFKVVFRKLELNSKTFLRISEAPIGKFKIQPLWKTVNRYLCQSIKIMMSLLYMALTQRRSPRQ